MKQQAGNYRTWLAIVQGCRRFLQKRDHQDWNPHSIRNNHLLEFLEHQAQITITITSDRGLYGYSIKGGGIIHKSPRFQDRSTAEVDAIYLLMQILPFSHVS